MAFDYEFEIEILARAARDYGYRQKIKRVTKDVSPWSSEPIKACWEMISLMGKADDFGPKIILKHADGFGDKAEEEDFISVAREVLGLTPTASGYAAEILAQWARRHTLIGGAGRVIDHLSRDDVDRAEEEISKLARAASPMGEGVEGGDWFTGFADRQAARLNELENPDESPVIRTRLQGLDNVFHGGIRQEQLGLIVGFTNVGKSFFALNFAFVSAAAGFTTIYISTEMSKTLVDTRLDARFFRRETADFYAHDFTPTDLAAFEARRDRLKDRLEQKLWTFATPMNSLTKVGLEEIIDEVQDSTGDKVGLLVMDSADHMLPMVPIREKRLQQSAVYWDLKTIIAERKLACWSTCHAPGDFKPLLGELDQAESKEKGKIADKIITLNQTPDEQRRDLLRAYVAKNRGGDKYTTHWIATDYARASIEETEPPDEDDDEDDGGTP